MFDNKEFKERADEVLLPRGKSKHNTGLKITPGMTKEQISEILYATQEKVLLQKLSELCEEDSVRMPSGMSRKERITWAQEQVKELSNG